MSTQQIHQDYPQLKGYKKLPNEEPRYKEEEATFLGTFKESCALPCDVYHRFERGREVIVVRWGDDTEDSETASLKTLLSKEAPIELDWIPEWLRENGYLQTTVVTGENVVIYCPECEERMWQDLSDEEEKRLTIEDAAGAVCLDCLGSSSA